MNPDDFVFPSQVAIGSKNAESCQFGLLKRELFAALAMQGMLASPAYDAFDSAAIAQRAVKRADDLLAELSKG